MRCSSTTIAALLDSKNFKLFKRNKDRLYAEIFSTIELITVLVIFGFVSNHGAVSVNQGPQAFSPKVYTSNSTLTACSTYGFHLQTDPCYVYFGDSEFGCSNGLKSFIEQEMSWCSLAGSVEEMQALYSNLMYVVPICTCGNTSNFGNTSWAKDSNVAVAIQFYESEYGRYTIFGPSIGVATDTGYSNVQKNVKKLPTSRNEYILPWQIAMDSALLGTDLVVKIGYFPQNSYKMVDVGVISMLPMYTVMIIMYSLQAIATEMCKENKGGMRHALFTVGLSPFTYWLSWIKLLLVRLSVVAIPMVLVFKILLVTTTDTTLFVLAFSLFVLWSTLFVVLAALVGLDPDTVVFVVTVAPSLVSAFSYAFVPYFLTPDFHIPIPAWVTVGVCWLMPPASFSLVMVIALFYRQQEQVLDFAAANEMTPFGVSLTEVIIPIAGNVAVYAVICIYLARTTTGIATDVGVVTGDATTAGAGPGGSVPLEFVAPFHENPEPKRVGSIDFDGIAMVNLNSVEKEEDGNANLRIAISVQNVEKCFVTNDGKTLRAVDGLSVDFYNDQITSLLGHNGAGKSTTIGVLTGLFPPDGGQAFIQGLSVRNDMARIRPLIGLCPQMNVCWDLLTVDEHLSLYAAIRGLSQTEATRQIDELLNDVSLTDKRETLARDLSGGQKRKLCLAMALIGDPKIVFLDEPTAGMDSSARRDVWELLLRKKEGKCIILCTHMMDEADILGDRVAVMSDGKLQVAANPTELKSRYARGSHLSVSVHAGTDRRELFALLCSHAGIDVEFDMMDMAEDPEERKLAEEELLGSREAADLKLIIPKDADLVSVIEMLEQRRGEISGLDGGIKIKDFGINATNLEDVFWELGRLAEVQRRGAEVSNLNDLRLKQMPKTLDLTPPNGVAKMTFMLRRLFLAYGRDWKKNFRNLFGLMIIMISSIVIADLSFNFSPASSPVVNLSATGLPFMGVKAPFLAPFDGTAQPVPGMLTALTRWATRSTGLLPEPYNATGVSPCLEAWLLSSNDANLCNDQFSQPLATNNSSNQPPPPGMPGAAGAYLFTSVDSDYPAAESLQYSVLSNQSIAWALPGLINFANNGIFMAKYHSKSPRLLFEYSQWQDHDDPVVTKFINNVITATIQTSLGVFFFIFPLFSVSGRLAVGLKQDVQNYVKQMQVLMGVTQTEYLLTRYVFDFAQFCVILIIPVMVMFGMKSRIASGATILLLFLYFFALEPIVHTIVKFVEEPPSAYSAVYLVLMLSFMVAYVTCTTLYGMSAFDENGHESKGDEVASFFMVFPPFALSQGLRAVIYANVFDYHPLQVQSPTNEFNVALPTAVEPCIYLCVEALLYNAIFIYCEHRRLWPCCSKIVRSCVQYALRCVCIDYCYRSTQPSRDEYKLAMDSDFIDLAQFSVHEIEDDDVQRERDEVIERELATAHSPHTTPTHGAATIPSSTLNPIAHRATSSYTAVQLTDDSEGAPLGAAPPEAAVLMAEIRMEYPPKGRQRFQGTIALHDFSLAIRQRECFSLLGSNGAGKTTVMSILLKQTAATAGRVYVAGQELFHMDEKTHCSMSYCPQVNALFDNLTTRECMQFYCQLRGVPTHELAEYVDQWMCAADLEGHTHTWCGNLSGGNKRKLSLAIALIGNPSVIVLDEPSAGVDPGARRKLHRLINATKRRGATLVLTTHHMDEAAALGDRVGIMVQGYMVCLGTVQHLLQKYGSGYVLSVLMHDGFPYEEWLTPPLVLHCPHLRVTQSSGPLYCSIVLGNSQQFSVAGVYKLLHELQLQGQVNYFSCGQSRLEDVFLGFMDKFLRGKVDCADVSDEAQV